MAREPVGPQGRVAQPGQGSVPRELARTGPGRADAKRDTAALLRSIRLLQIPTPSLLSTPPGHHARDARAVASGRPEEGEESPAPGWELGSTPATVLKAFCCGQEVRHNKILHVSFCLKCGRHGPFLIRSFSPFQTALRGV